MFIYGVSTSILDRKKDTVFDAIKFAVKHKFDVIEIVCETPEILPGYTNPEFIKRVKDLAESGRLKIQLHAPFYSINLASFDDEFLNFSRKEILKTIELGYKLEADKITLHIGLCFLPCQFFKEKAMEIAAESMKILLNEASDCGIKLAVENRGGKLDLGKVDELVKLIEMVNSDNLGITFDVVQANVLGDPLEQLKVVEKYLINTHIRDAPRGKEGLLAVGEGEIDFSSIIEEFIRIGFKGPLIFEVSSRDRAIISRATVEEILEELNKKKLDSNFDSIMLSSRSIT